MGDRLRREHDRDRRPGHRARRGHTTADGDYGSIAMGALTHASGDAATSMGFNTTALCNNTSDDFPLANGACVAMGIGITNNQSEALAVSGNVLAKNVHLFGADARLLAVDDDANDGPNADPDPAALLAAADGGC